MTKPRGPDPADVMECTCRANPGLDPAFLAKKILADLNGHGLKIVAVRAKAKKASPKAAAAIAYCQGGCTRVQLHNGRCPICGWSDES